MSEVQCKDCMVKLRSTDIYCWCCGRPTYQNTFTGTLGDDEIVCIWPDDTWCLLEDLESYLTMMSDDYKRVHIDSIQARNLIGE